MRIGDRKIGEAHPPFIIAEMSGNHNQSLERALTLIDAAADAGAHAVKLQTYTADTMTLDIRTGDFVINDPESLWTGRSLYDLYQEAHTPWDWHSALFERAEKRGILCFSTPFDDSAVDLLERLSSPCYKIASFENTYLPLIRRVAATGKPLIISTGMASVGQLQETVEAARSSGCRDLVLLKCTSTYPASPENTNLRTIPHLRELFGCEVGLSDHTMGVGAGVASVAFGARVIEKHFTLKRADGGIDSAFSLEPHELEQLVVETERAWKALGVVQYGGVEAERASAKHRRTIYVVQDLEVGDTLTPQNVRCIRPGGGLETKHYDAVLGRSINQPVKRGTPLTWNLMNP